MIYITLNSLLVLTILLSPNSGREVPQRDVDGEILNLSVLYACLIILLSANQMRI